MNLLERFFGTLQAIIDYQIKCLQEDKERRLKEVFYRKTTDDVIKDMQLGKSPKDKYLIEQTVYNNEYSGKFDYIIYTLTTEYHIKDGQVIERNRRK